MVGLDRYRLLVQYCPRPNGLAERVSYNRGYRFVGKLEYLWMKAEE